MAAFSRFSEDVSEEELNALIQKAIPEKTNRAKKYDLKTLKGNKKKKELELSNKQFASFTRRIVAGVSSALVVWIKSIIVYQKKYCYIVSSSEISTKTIWILALNFYLQSIEIESEYSNC